ncbi:MAG: radical SAM protein, partial [Candidatus Omnitrophica bacterium]|nr:radical SAM protein [Candidatus Omnitrophota bacterium]
MVESLYIHIPFCRKKCFYCDFYSVNYKENLASVYIETLCKQIDKLEDDFSTIYIGGGTPTVLGAPHLGKLLKSLKRVSKKVIEFTVEANPESLDEANIELFLAEGVNRLSIGAQSVNEGKLKKLGRIHSVKQAQEAVFLAKKKGFKNISIDLIFGLWNEDLAGWQEELSWAVKLPVTH